MAHIQKKKRLLPNPLYERIRDLKLFGTRAFSAKTRLLPDFLIIGAARSGTTSLYSYLEHHPNIKGAFTKEIHFFDNRYFRGLNWYRIHFPTLAENEQILNATGHPLVTGEATPTYLFDESVPPKVYDDLPQVKLIVLLRNPVERAFSSHSLMVKMGVEDLSFEDALIREDRFPDDLRHVAFHYKKRGVYIDQIKKWFEYFPPESFLICKSEDFFSDTQSVFNDVCQFIGLPACDMDGFPKLNSATKSEMNPSTREKLQDYFEEHNRKLEEMLGRTLEWD